MSRATWLLLPLAVLASCSDDNDVPFYPPVTPDAATPDATSTDASVDVVPKGARVLGATVDLGDNSVVNDLADLNDAGGHAVDLGLSWDDVEQPFDAGADADTDASTFIFAPVLHVANLLFPPAKTSVALSLAAIDPSGARLPVDLKGRAFDDADVMARFDALLDYAVNQLPDTTLDVILVGDRVDFGDDTAKWNAFSSFVAHARDHAHGKRAGLAVSFSVAAAVLGKPAAGPALAAADVTAVHFPAVDAVTADFSGITAAPANKPVILLGVGYPAGNIGANHQAEQAAFVDGTFAAWDTSRISRITFAFLDDPSASTVETEATKVGRTDSAFKAAYGSLGLRAANGTSRPAFEAFRKQARARGF